MVVKYLFKSSSFSRDVNSLFSWHTTRGFVSIFLWALFLYFKTKTTQREGKWFLCHNTQNCVNMIYLPASWDPKTAARATVPTKKDMITSRRTPSHLPLAITIIYDWLWTSLYLRKEATDSFLYQGVKTLCTTDNASKVTFSIFFWTYILLVEMLSEKRTLNHAIIKLKLFGSLVSAVLLVSGLACHHIYCRYIFFKRC